jgi:small subunit ribosomal protein S6
MAVEPGSESPTPTKVASSGREGWLREYETVFLVSPDQTDEDADKLAERLRALVEKEGGRVIKFTHWGRRKTAFTVAKNTRALFIQISFLGNGQVVTEIERNLRNAEEVSRFQTSLVKKMVNPDTRPTEEDVHLAPEVEERPGMRSDRPDGLPGVDGALGDDLLEDPTAEPGVPV